MPHFLFTKKTGFLIVQTLKVFFSAERIDDVDAQNGFAQGCVSDF